LFYLKGHTWVIWGAVAYISTSSPGCAKSIEASFLVEYFMSRIEVFPGAFQGPAFLLPGENRSCICGRFSLPLAVHSDASFSYCESVHEGGAFPTGAFTLLKQFFSLKDNA